MILFLTAMLQAAAPAAAAPPLPWTASMRTDDVTKKLSGSASATSFDGTSRLVVRCDRRTTDIVSIQFIPNPPFIPASPRPVSIAVDDGPVFGANWEFPGRGAVMSDSAIVTNLTVAIAHGKSIRVHVIDPSDKPVDATFPGPATDASIKQVLSACGYTLGVDPEAAQRSAAPAPAQAPNP